jgi:multiple sugar transport system ATP-binding protein
LAPATEEGEAAAPLYKGKSVWTARVDARSAARAGDQIELGVDTRSLYFFDPGSGLAIGNKQAPEPRPARRGAPAAALQEQR